MEIHAGRDLDDQDSLNETRCTRADADAGNAEAQFGMGLRCAIDGAAPDYLQAAEWYRKAADQNHYLAQFNLGQMFVYGHGVERDDATATLWIRRSADGGDAGAQFNMGDGCYRESMNPTVNNAAESRIEAYKWDRLAADQGYGASQNSCDTVTLRMTREEVAEGIQRASAFAASRESK